MIRRTYLNHGICLTSALALLVAVMTSPLRPLSPSGTSSHLDCLRRNFALPSAHTTYLRVKCLRAAPVKAVRSEREDEKLGRTKSPAGCSFPQPLSLSLKTPGSAPGVFPLARTSQPLR